MLEAQCRSFIGELFVHEGHIVFAINVLLDK